VKLVINGVEYDATAQPFIGDLRLLKKEFGFGWGTVASRLAGINEDADMMSMLDDDDVLEALVAWMWMSRLRAGERATTRADVELTPIDSIRFVGEPGDDADEGDAAPTSAPTDSGRGGAGEPTTKQHRKPSTKTSKKPSTAA
jgi:hypothetical protein